MKLFFYIAASTLCCSLVHAAPFHAHSSSLIQAGWQATPVKIGIARKTEEGKPISGSYKCVDKSGKKHQAELNYKSNQRIVLKFQGKSIQFHSRGSGDDQVYASIRKDNKGRTYEFDVGNNSISIRIYGPGTALVEHGCDLTS